MDFLEVLVRAPAILTEGSVIERLRRDPAVELDPFVLHSAFIYDPLKRATLQAIYRQYLGIGHASRLPMLVLTPTWRANPERLMRAGLEGKDLNGDCARFLAQLRREYRGYARRVFIGGLMGCKGDAYRPQEALPRKEAVLFHRAQAEALGSAGVDFLIASTLPAMSEALGMSEAMAGLGLPYIMSFIVGPQGALLDGTPLHEAISSMDREISRPPAAYMVNCVHPSAFRTAFAHEAKRMPSLAVRLVGLQANTSAKSPQELENRPVLDTEEPEVFADAMLTLNRDLGIRVLGGCCGTDQRHIQLLAERWVKRQS